MLRNPAWNKDSPIDFLQHIIKQHQELDSDLNAFNVVAYTSMHKENVFSLVS